jgi:hypothetical protein
MTPFSASPFSTDTAHTSPTILFTNSNLSGASGLSVRESWNFGRRSCRTRLRRVLRVLRVLTVLGHRRGTLADALRRGSAEGGLRIALTGGFVSGKNTATYARLATPSATFAMKTVCQQP